MKHYTLLFLSLFGLLFSSCDDGELDLWEVVELEATCPLLSESENHISYKETTTTVDIKTNGMWSIAMPDWMHTETTEGCGDATVVISIDSNKDSKKSRQGNISIISRQAPENNVAGRMKIILPTIVQESGFEQVRISFASKCWGQRIWSGDYNYYNCYYNCTGEYSYTIESDLSDDELRDVLSNLKIEVKDEKNRATYWELIDLPTTRGTHSGTYPERKWYADALVEGPDEIGNYRRKWINYHISYNIIGVGERNISMRLGYWDLQK